MLKKEPICIYKAKSFIICFFPDNSKFYKCGVCLQEFIRYGSFMRHRFSHNPESLPCNVCGEENYSYTDWQQHRKSCSRPATKQPEKQPGTLV